LETVPRLKTQESRNPEVGDERRSYRHQPYTKSDRLSQISKQKLSGARSSPPELHGAEMFDFGSTMMMVEREQRPGATSYYNTRKWIRRDAHWLMLFSFNTRTE
jgi:hypothetical protein